MKKIMLVAAMAVALALSMVAGAAAAEGTYETYTITVESTNGFTEYAHVVTLQNDCENNWTSQSDDAQWIDYLNEGWISDETFIGKYTAGGEPFYVTFELESDGTLGAVAAPDWDVDLGTASGTWSSDSEPCEPTTKDDCKDGGWEDYGYRNQGQCVSSVATA